MKHECVLCGKSFKGEGHDPNGAALCVGHNPSLAEIQDFDPKNQLRIKGEVVDGVIFPEFKEDERCCDDCYYKLVIPGKRFRIKYELYMKK